MTAFTKLNKNTKRAEKIIRAYENAWATQLCQVYPTHYSSAKASAYKDCVEIMNDLGGSDLKITGACGNFFSVAFHYVKDGKYCLAYITHANNFSIELRDAYDTDSMSDDEWLDNLKSDYDGLCETTKKHLANACPHITSREQADGIMRMTKAFDALFRFDEEKAKGTN